MAREIRVQSMSKNSKVFMGVLAVFIIAAVHRMGSANTAVAVGLAPMLGLVMFLGAVERLEADSWSGRVLRWVPGHKVVLKAQAASMAWGTEVRAFVALAMIGWFYLVVLLAG